jgi:hypothetical protein
MQVNNCRAETAAHLQQISGLHIYLGLQLALVLLGLQALVKQLLLPALQCSLRETSGDKKVEVWAQAVLGG